MDDVARKGRTVLFVSHNIKAIQHLCKECMLLQAGRIAIVGKTANVIHEYFDPLHARLQSTISKSVKGHDIQIRIMDECGQETYTWKYNGGLVIQISVSSKSVLFKPAIDIAFYNQGSRIFAMQSDKLCESPESVEGSWNVSFYIKDINIVLEELYMDIGIREKNDPYLILLDEVVGLKPDYKAIPPTVLTDCVLSPKVECIWRLLDQ
jgi:ABC-type glutathione transport system ATPase component